MSFFFPKHTTHEENQLKTIIPYISSNKITILSIQASECNPAWATTRSVSRWAGSWPWCWAPLLPSSSQPSRKTHRRNMWRLSENRPHPFVLLPTPHETQIDTQHAFPPVLTPEKRFDFASVHSNSIVSFTSLPPAKCHLRKRMTSWGTRSLIPFNQDTDARNAWKLNEHGHQRPGWRC